MYLYVLNFGIVHTIYELGTQETIERKKIIAVAGKIELKVINVNINLK